MKMIETLRREPKTISLLTTEHSWFNRYGFAESLVEKLRSLGYACNLYFSHSAFNEKRDVCFILSYFKIIPREFLDYHFHNIVIHESDLPEGKGWSPLFWQILENKNKIPVTLFEATEELDAGPYYIKDFIQLNGYELHDDIRKKQADKTIELCTRFLKEYVKLRPIIQTGQSTYYPRRTPDDSRLDIDKTIREQFNILRICSNDDFPAFFYMSEKKYILKIYLADK
ncbi:MAG: formyltransferase family protein [Candidatus Bathyarchaeia archaeon]